MYMQLRRESQNRDIFTQISSLHAWRFREGCFGIAIIYYITTITAIAMGKMSGFFNTLYSVTSSRSENAKEQQQPLLEDQLWPIHIYLSE